MNWILADKNWKEIGQYSGDPESAVRIAMLMDAWFLFGLTQDGRIVEALILREE